MRSLSFRIGDIPVSVDPSFWIIMGLFGLQRATRRGGFDAVVVVEWIVMVFIGILVHELGHAVSFRAFGRKPSVILYAMGGLTSADGALPPAKRLASTLAGPGVGLAIGFAAYFAMQAGLLGLDNLQGQAASDIARWSFDPVGATSRLPELIFLDLLFINIAWGVFNLVPLYPLDGGQSLESLLDLLRVKGAAQITSVISILVSVALGYWAVVTVGAPLLALFAVFFGVQNLRRLSALRNPKPVDPTATDDPSGTIGPSLRRTLAMAEQAIAQGREGDAADMVAQEFAIRPSPSAAQAYAAVLARTQRFDDLERLSAHDDEVLGPAALSIIAAALIAGGRYPAALKAAEGGWNTDPSGHWQHAVTAAAARAGMRDVEGAVRWLYMAADRGWTDRRRLESDPMFAEVRVDPRLADILARMGV